MNVSPKERPYQRLTILLLNQPVPFALVVGPEETVVPMLGAWDPLSGHRVVQRVKRELGPCIMRGMED